MKPRSLIVREGFTLVELLVAIAILSVILVGIGQMLGVISVLTTEADKHLDANNQARSVFDRMANDFARMIKRNDVDYIFYKNSGANGNGANDTMFFYTQGSSYFDTSSFSTNSTYPSIAYVKNPVSLVGYRINNINTASTASSSGSSTYYQMERLGKALSWDATPSINPVVFLTYPPAGIDVDTIDSDNPPNGSFSTAFFDSTLYGAYSSGSGAAPSLVGTLANGYNDGVDDVASSSTTPPPNNPYHPVAARVFRFEFSFQLKDGTESTVPVMSTATSSDPNGVPYSNLSATQRPLPTDDSSSDNGTGPYVIGSRWYDTTNHIGYICVSATPNYAQWKEIGIQDIAAVVVTIAVIDKQGLFFVNRSGIDMATVAAQFADSGTNGTIAANLVSSWTAAINSPSAGGKSTVSANTGIPQSMVSQIRIYQRFFYVNNP